MADEPLTTTPFSEIPPQHQSVHSGIESIMIPRPISENPLYKGSGKLEGKVAIVSGGDSGIGRAVSIAFAKEGADVVIVYLNEHCDATETKMRIEQVGRRCLAIAADLRVSSNSKRILKETIRHFGHLDILVNNCGVGWSQLSLQDISDEQLEDTFRTNIFSFFYLTRAALKYLKSGSTIINTASKVAYIGNELMIDYASTKGAIVSFTRSLSKNLVSHGIRVNGVAPGHVWTPLIPSAYPAEKVPKIGRDVPMERISQPFELAPAYVYLASDDSSFVTGQIIHVNGGVMVGG